MEALGSDVGGFILGAFLDRKKKPTGRECQSGVY